MPKETHANEVSRGQTGAPSEERRRLLKAAAASAPVIATLPSGLAAQMANSSTNQCILNNREASDDMGSDFDITDSADNWVRFGATLVTATKTFKLNPDNSGAVDTVHTRKYYRGMYPVGPGQGETFYIVSDTWDPIPKIAGADVIGELQPTEGELALNGMIKGNKLTGGLPVDWDTETSGQNLLAMWMETKDSQGFVNGVVFVDAHPAAIRTENMGITGSCLCSAAPGEGENICIR